jgi:hypothetical protein
MRKWFIGFGGAAVAILLGIGWGMSGVINFHGVLWCFVVSALLLTGVLWVGEEFSQIPRQWKIILGCLGTQIIGIGLLRSVQFVLEAQPTPPVNEHPSLPSTKSEEPRKESPKESNSLTPVKAIELANTVQRIGDDLSKRIETITNDYAQQERGLPEEEVKHYEPFKENEMQKARDRAKSVYEECCRGRAQEFRRKFGDVTDSRMEFDFDSPLNSMGYWRVAADLRKLATLVATRKDSRSQMQINNAPNGIAIGGGTVINPTVNNGPPPLELVSSYQILKSEKQGLVKTMITVVPNKEVSAPFDLVLDFDAPIVSVGFWIAGAGSVSGGGPSASTEGSHAVLPIGTGFGPNHALLLTVYSFSQVKLVKTPVIK